jgi:hypothetical protein
LGRHIHALFAGRGTVTGLGFSHRIKIGSCFAVFHLLQLRSPGYAASKSQIRRKNALGFDFGG